MIAFVKGRLADVTETSVVLDTGNIGYEIFVTGNDMQKCRTAGQEIKLYTYFSVREDAMQLYGFLSRDDLEMFRLLIGVSGIGPRSALGILSGISSDDLRFAVLSDDVKTISRAPGIGKKTAQKMILELKDKLKLEDAFEVKLAHQEDLMKESGITDSSQEAVEALAALGYTNTEALRAVRQVKDTAGNDVEAILKAALKNL